MPIPPTDPLSDGPAASRSGSLLGDSPARDYSSKLDLFTRFAAPELRSVISDLDVRPGARVLDAGCGTGLVTSWLAQSVGADGVVLGVDLATAHGRTTHERASQTALPIWVVQGDVLQPPLRPRWFDLIWSSNTLNHIAEPLEAVRVLREHLRPGGRLVLGQSAFLPDMFFAWDARLENRVAAACRLYYRDKYGLTERDTAAVRNLLGLLRAAGFSTATVQTRVIERTSPLSADDERYLCEAVFWGYWGEKLRPYLAPEDWDELERLCEPTSPDFCLRRPDFHHMQTFTVAVGSG